MDTGLGKFLQVELQPLETLSQRAVLSQLGGQLGVLVPQRQVLLTEPVVLADHVAHPNSDIVDRFFQRRGWLRKATQNSGRTILRRRFDLRYIHRCVTSSTGPGLNHLGHLVALHLRRRRRRRRWRRRRRRGAMGLPMGSHLFNLQVTLALRAERLPMRLVQVSTEIHQAQSHLSVLRAERASENALVLVHEPSVVCPVDVRDVGVLVDRLERAQGARKGLLRGSRRRHSFCFTCPLLTLKTR